MTAADESSGWIFDIQGFSLHDGPGTRTTVFLLGCPLCCRWCSNPEGLFARPRLLFKPGRCARPVSGCNACLDACPFGKIRADAGSGTVRVDRPPLGGAMASPRAAHLSEAAPAAVARPPKAGGLTGNGSYPGAESGAARGAGCGAPCVEACPHEALTLGGRSVQPPELERILSRDRRFWGSGGGVTFSGGEPLGQPAFLLQMLRWCRGRGIHAAIETSAFARSEVFQGALDLVEFAFLDLKMMDPARHLEWTGVDNRVILENVRTAAARNPRPRLVVRVPLIAGVNDDPGNLESLGGFMGDAGLEEVNLLPFHAMGTTKWQHCGLETCQTGLRAPDQAGMKAAADLLRRFGRTVYLGHETPF